MSATTAAAAAAGAAASSAASTAATTKTNQEASLNRQSYSDLDIDSDLAALSLNSDLITSVSLDGLALTKIVKHSRDSHPNNSSGTLLGLDIGGTLEVSNVFPLPNNLISGNEEEENGKSGRSAARYTQKMLQLLHDVNADDNPVGLYYGGFLGTFLSTPVVDQLAQIAGLMEREGSSGKGKGVLIVHDLAQSAQGNTVVRAYRLSPSFIEAHRKGKFNTQSLIDHKLTFATILVEIPVTLRNTALLDAFLSTLSTPSIPAQLIPPTTSSQLQNPPVSSIPSSNNSSLLTLAHTPILTSGLESVLDALDEHNSEAGNVGFQQRQMLREKARAEAYIQRKKAENLQREKEGKNPLPVEDAYRLFKVPDEPKRLESLLLLGKLDDSAAKLAEATATAAVKLHAARTGTA